MSVRALTVIATAAVAALAACGDDEATPALEAS